MLFQEWQFRRTNIALACCPANSDNARKHVEMILHLGLAPPATQYGPGSPALRLRATIAARRVDAWAAACRGRGAIEKRLQRTFKKRSNRSFNRLRDLHSFFPLLRTGPLHGFAFRTLRLRNGQKQMAQLERATFECANVAIWII